MTTTFAAAFIALYVGHMVGDHVTQTDHQAAHKASAGWAGARAMFGHILGYTATQLAALAAVHFLLGPLPLAGITAGLALSATTHAFIDRRWPVQWLCRNTGSEAFGKLADHGVNGAYLVDQTLHIACLFASALLVAAMSRG